MQIGMLVENGFPNGIATPCHGPAGYVAVVSLGFSVAPAMSPEERNAIQLASMVLHNRMRELSSLRNQDLPKLSGRERDCMAFVAEGKSDWEISAILGVSHTTVISHVQNAKRKLGAATRAQAVARCLTAGLL